MIKSKMLRNLLKVWFGLVDKQIIIKRKKKMMLEQTSNGKIRTVRRNVIKIEIIE